MVLAAMSMLMMSPSSTAAIGPPTAASGATWPTMNPRVAPLKRPSVISATVFAEARAYDRAGHAQHFAHARAAPRPLVADHQHIAGLISPRRDGCMASSSRSNTRAGPRWLLAVDARSL